MKTVLWIVLCCLLLGTPVMAEPLVVWTWYAASLGQAFRELVETDFTARTGIEVDIITVPIDGHFNKFLLSYLGGDAPDVLELYSNQVVELGMRGALTNLRTLPNIDAVLDQMTPGLMRALTFKNGVFGIPGELNWTQTYYRTDILGDLGLEAPTTWSDWLSINTRLRSRGMTTFYDYQGDTGAKVTGMLLPLVYQRGGDIYNAEGTASTLDSPEAIDAFRFLTSLYTDHKLDMENPIWTPFTNGDTPLMAIQNWYYTGFYLNSPQIRGNWDIAAFPGTLQRDGSINHTNSGKMLVWTIPSSSKRQQQAWEFVQWLASADYLAKFTHAAFNGPDQNRLIFATRDALEMAVFPPEQLPVLRTSLNNCVMNRAVVGGYIADRYSDFAFNKVVLSGEDPEAAIRQAARETTSEIQLKLREFARFIDRL